MPVQQHVGRPIKRIEDPKLITGSDPYVNDFKLAGALYLAFVRSPYAHAVLTRIDTTAPPARCPAWWPSSPAPISTRGGGRHPHAAAPEMFASMNRQGHTLLAEGRVRHVGEPVVVVAAESSAAAVDSADAVVVDYDPLPVVVDAAEALKPGAPLLYPKPRPISA